MAAKKFLYTPEQIIAKKQKLKGERGNWESYWQEVTDHVNPRRNNVISQKSDGARRDFQLLDNVGVHSNELLAGALHSFLTNPNSPWLEATTGVLALDNHENVRPWLQNTGRTILNMLNNSNFQSEVHEMYLDLTSIGTALQTAEEDDETDIRFSTKFIADYYIVENSKGEVAEVYYSWKWNAKQIIEAYGVKNVPEDVKKAHKEKPDLQFTVCHAVYPELNLNPKASPNKIVSQYIIEECKEDLKHEYYTSFPYFVPRWGKSSGETYGRSPGMNALPELKVLNRMNATMLIGAQKMVDPPLQMEDDGVVLPLITRPGGINFRRPGTAEIRPIFANTNIEFGYQAMADRRQRVRDAYFVDKLQLNQQGPTMTATEVVQRTEDSIRLIGPMVGRMETEYLRPLFDRAYDIADRRGLIATPPVELQGRKVFARYTSVIAKAQRVSQGQAIMRTFQSAAPFIQLDPTVADYFNGPNIVKVLADIYGAPYETIRPDSEVKKMAEARAAQAQAQQEAMQQAAQLQVAAPLAAGQG